MDCDWLTEEFAGNWDRDLIHSSSTKGGHLDVFLDLLADEYKTGKNIFYVGFFWQNLFELIWQRIPNACIGSMDLSSLMIYEAQQKLEIYKEQQVFDNINIIKMENIEFPKKSYPIIISIPRKINILCKQKTTTFNLVHKLLERNGLFLILAQIAVAPLYCLSCYTSDQKQQGESYSALVNEGETFEAYAKQKNTKGNRAAQLEQYLSGICEAGFKLACLHLYGNYALIGARKI